MKAAVLHELGGIPRFEDFPDPIPQNSDEVVVQVTAASIKNIDKSLVKGSHYAKFYTQFPCVVGIDGVGRLEDGTHVMTGALPTSGIMAERALVSKARCFPVPNGIDDVTAAALPNPALSAWFGLSWRAQLKPGDSVLIMGATGVTGKLAVQLAKQLGAGRVVATGRNETILEQLRGLGADSTISLAQPDEALKTALATEAKLHPFNAVIDYVWGHPAEVLLSALTGQSLSAEAHTTRYVQVGAMAGPTLALAAATLRSAGVELYGMGGGSVPKAVMAKVPTEILPYLFDLVLQGKLHIDTEQMPLSDVEQAWQRDVPGKRIVIVP